MEDSSDFAGRVAVVLGGSGGIGQALCAALSERGAKVVSLSRGKADAADLTISTDVADQTQVAEAFDQIDRDVGPVTLLVCASGVVREAPVEEMETSDWQTVIDASLTGSFYAIRAALPSMRASGGGAIVAIGSGYGRKGYRNGANYAAAKGGLEGLIKSVALETAAEGIRANVVAPGPIETPMIDHIEAERLAATTAAIPQGRIGKPEEVVEPTLFLLSSAASHITGQVVHVNGGLLMP